MSSQPIPVRVQPTTPAQSTNAHSVTYLRRVAASVYNTAKSIVRDIRGTLQRVKTRPRACVAPPLPPEILSVILRSLPGPSVETKQALLACRLVNKEWGHLAWTLFWVSVSVGSGERAERRYLHHSASEFMKGIHIRKFAVWESPCRRRMDVLLGAPMMQGIRILIYACKSISTAQLFLIFLSLPLLVGLYHIRVENGPVEWGDVETHTRGDKEEGAVWKKGFGNLKALSIRVKGGPVRGFDLLDVMAANLGVNLEYVNLFDFFDHERTRLRSFYCKVAENCPNLKAYTFNSNTLHLFPHSTTRLLSCLVYLEVENGSDDLIKSLAATCTHLKYLSIRCSSNGATQEGFRHLATGPFLSALSVTASEPPSTTACDDGLALFLKERGKSVTFLEMNKCESDETLRMIRDFCPELRELRVVWGWDVTEDGFVAFLQGSRKLRRMNLPLYPRNRSEAIRHAAEEGNVDIEANVRFPTYLALREESWMGW
ncbi:hypothetical protein HK104_009753 [Borealophlyctis nickersoniae]|nr:hypothetical protein HK104_009753 [Borealophlyctis nickersoniae]